MRIDTRDYAAPERLTVSCAAVRLAQVAPVAGAEDVPRESVERLARCVAQNVAALRLQTETLLFVHWKSEMLFNHVFAALLFEHARGTAASALLELLFGYKTQVLAFRHKAETQLALQTALLDALRAALRGAGATLALEKTLLALARAARALTVKLPCLGALLAGAGLPCVAHVEARRPFDFDLVLEFGAAERERERALAGAGSIAELPRYRVAPGRGGALQPFCRDIRDGREAFALHEAALQLRAAHYALFGDARAANLVLWLAYNADAFNAELPRVAQLCANDNVKSATDTVLDWLAHLSWQHDFNLNDFEMKWTDAAFVRPTLALGRVLRRVDAER